MQTEAQKRRKKKYLSKRPERGLCFKYFKTEADAIDEIIKASGMSKAMFLRKAVEAYTKGKF